MTSTTSIPKEPPIWRMVMYSGPLALASWPCKDSSPSPSNISDLLGGAPIVRVPAESTDPKMGGMVGFHCLWKKQKGQVFLYNVSLMKWVNNKG